jgi:hypothetical protein
MGENLEQSFNEYRYLLNFTNQITFPGSPSTEWIYHLNDNLISNATLDHLKIKDFAAKVYPVAKGNKSHLAYSPTTNNTHSSVCKNNRIFEFSDSITSNPMYFYPFEECTSCISARYSLSFSHVSNGGSITNTKTNIGGVQQNLAINLPYQAVNDSSGNYIIPIKMDTLYSDWFNIDSTGIVEYLISMNDTNHVSMKLQKLSDSSFVDLPAPFLTGSGFSHLVYHLVNGNFDEYRLAMVNNDTLLQYSEDLNLDDAVIIDTIYSKKGFEVKQNVINLNKNIQTNKLFSINCMPNPANEILNIAVYSNQSTKVESVSIKIYNQQGMLVNEYQSSINSTLSIPVTHMSNGVYMIKASIFTPDGIYNESSKVMILK